MAWFGRNLKYHLVPSPLLWAGTLFTRPGCSDLHHKKIVLITLKNQGSYYVLTGSTPNEQINPQHCHPCCLGESSSRKSTSLRKAFCGGGLMNIHCVHTSNLVAIYCRITTAVLRGGFGSIALNKSWYALNQASPDMKREEKWRTSHAVSETEIQEEPNSIAPY